MKQDVHSCIERISAKTSSDFLPADMDYARLIRFSSSWGLSVLLLLLPFSFLATCCLDMLLLRGRLSSRFRTSSASFSARSSFCCTVRAGDDGGGCFCSVHWISKATALRGREIERGRGTCKGIRDLAFEGLA